MNLLQNLPTDATDSEIKQIAKTLMIDIEIKDNKIDCWFGDKWLGNTFKQSGLLSILNNQIDLYNADVRTTEESIKEIKLIEQDQAKVAAEERAEKAKKMIGFTDAAIILDGEVVGYCETDARAGEEIAVFGCVTSNGTPVNVRYAKVSRSKINLNKARNECYFDVCFYKDEAYYTHAA